LIERCDGGVGEDLSKLRWLEKLIYGFNSSERACEVSLKASQSLGKSRKIHLLLDGIKFTFRKIGCECGYFDRDDYS
jgi:hypothetical protein